MAQKKYLKILSLILTLIVAGFFFSNWNDIIQIFYKINTGWAFTGFVFYVMNYVFRGTRLRIMTGYRIDFFKEAFHFSILHGFLSYLLPMRTGDASLPILLKATNKIDLKNSISVLLKSRIIDLSMVGCFTCFGALMGARIISSMVQGLWLLSGFLIMLSWFFFKKIGSIGNYLIKKKFEYDFDISTIFLFNHKEFLHTFIVWVFIYISQYCMIRSIGLNLQLSEVIFISAIQFPLQMLPVQGLANSGNHEGGWVSSLVLMGFGTQDALKYAIASHGVLILYVALLGLLALITGNAGMISIFKKIYDK